MLPLSVQPLGFHPQDLCDALPPAEVQGGVHRVTAVECRLMPPAVPLGTLEQPQEARRPVVVGCVTPVLCRSGALRVCNWPACCGAKGRG